MTAYEIARIIAWIVMGPMFAYAIVFAVGGAIYELRQKREAEERHKKEVEEYLRKHYRPSGDTRK